MYGVFECPLVENVKWLFWNCQKFLMTQFFHLSSYIVNNFHSKNHCLKIFLYASCKKKDVDKNVPKCLDIYCPPKRKVCTKSPLNDLCTRVWLPTKFNQNVTFCYLLSAKRARSNQSVLMFSKIIICRK